MKSPLALIFLLTCTLHGQVREVRIKSSLDGAEQPAFFYTPKKADKPMPLVVLLHSWSADYRQKFYPAFPKWCVEKGWAYIHPNFRGPNRNPRLCHVVSRSVTFCTLFTICHGLSRSVTIM